VESYHHRRMARRFRDEIWHATAQKLIGGFELRPLRNAPASSIWVRTMASNRSLSQGFAQNRGRRVSWPRPRD